MTGMREESGSDEPRPGEAITARPTEHVSTGSEGAIRSDPPTPDALGPSSVSPTASERQLVLQRIGPTNRTILVFACGLLTSIVTLLGVYLVRVEAQANVMGWYFWGIPVGAVLVGMTASSGYALAAWYSGSRIRKSLMLSVALVQLLAYFAANYLEFQAAGPFASSRGGEMGFLEYYDATTRAMTFQETTRAMTSRDNRRLGVRGYLFRFGEILGFLVGNCGVLAMIASIPFCELCERYLKRSMLAFVVPESMPAEFEELARMGRDKDIPGFATWLANRRRTNEANGQLKHRGKAQMVYCVQCASGYLEFTELHGTGSQEQVLSVRKMDLDPEVVKNLVAQKLV
jgi:hypothetical protein